MLPIVEIELYRLYKESKSDREIAEEVGLHYKTVARWRRSKHLKHRGKPGRPRKGNESENCSTGGSY